MQSAVSIVSLAHHTSVETGTLVTSGMSYNIQTNGPGVQVHQWHTPVYMCRRSQQKCRDSRLRQPSDPELHRPIPNKAIGAAAFGFVGPDWWNKLPERLRESASLNFLNVIERLTCFVTHSRQCEQ